MSGARLLGPALLALLLTGCIHDEPPVPEDNPVAATAEPAPPAPPAPIESAGGTVIVARGQTLYAVARAAHVPVRALIDANRLQPPYKLAAGQSLTVPYLRQHIVAPGETLYAVARDYGVEASSLARENHLNPPYKIKNGAVLILPAPVEAAPGPRPAIPPSASASAALAPSPTAAPAPSPVTPPASGATEPPAAGSGAISVTVLPPPPTAGPAGSAPAGAEAAHAPTPLQPVVAPPPVRPAARSASATPPVTLPSAATPAAPAPATPAPPPEPENGAAPPPAVPASAPEIAALVANHAEPVAPLFLWPVRGRILSVFGDAAGGAHNDGINIAAPEGTTVSAAESGIVAYAGNELRGFGNLLLIKHPDGWVTAYAHNQVLLVKKGQKVRRGQPVARIGKSGGVSEAQLHFELRRGTKAVDPLDHLPQQTGASG